MKFWYKNQKGFTLFEIMIYLFIATTLLVVISGLVMSIFNARRYFISINNVNHNARFIVHYLSNRLHNVDLMADNSLEAPGVILFYKLPDTYFSVELSGDDMIYREAVDTGSGYPPYANLEQVPLNNSTVDVSDLSLLMIYDYTGTHRSGVQISFTLSSGSVDDHFAYYEKDFSTFISIR